MSKTSRSTIVVISLVALVALVALAACSDDEVGPLPQPSSQLPSETPAAPTGPTGATGKLPTTSPAAGTGNLSSGEVTLRVAGDVEAEKTLTQLITAVFTPPPGGLALVWTAGGADASTVGIGGPSFAGTQATSPALSLTLVVQTQDGISSFLSSDGECDITIDVATERGLAGGFACIGLDNPAGQVVDVSASFEATG